VKFFEKYYRTLEIPAGSTNQEIKAAYRRLAKLYHPDRSGDPNTRGKFIDVNEAYEILLRRDEYIRDALLRYQKRQAAQNAMRNSRGREYAAGARERAASNSYKRYSEFEKSPIYRTAVVFNSAVNYLFVAIGMIMIISPFLGYYNQLTYGRPDGKEPEFHILPIFLGILFLYGLWYFLIKNKES